jgi:hypothetical protein
VVLLAGPTAGDLNLAVDLPQSGTELEQLAIVEAAENLTDQSRPGGEGTVVGFPAGWGEVDLAGASIGGIRSAFDQTVSLQDVDEFRDGARSQVEGDGQSALIRGSGLFESAEEFGSGKGQSVLAELDVDQALQSLEGMEHQFCDLNRIGLAGHLPSVAVLVWCALVQSSS